MKDEYKELADFLDNIMGWIDAFPNYSSKINDTLTAVLKQAAKIGGKLYEDTERLYSSYQYLLTSPAQSEQLIQEFKRDCLTLKNDLWEL